MTQSDAAGTGERQAPRGRAGKRSLMIILGLPLVIAAIGGVAGYWYVFVREGVVATDRQAPEAELPLPVYLEIKPFVISVANSAGAPHFVQVGLNLTLSSSNAGNAVSALLPEVQDAVRQTALGFKVDDILTPAGVDKLREAMVVNANQALLRRLGVERAKRLGGDAPSGGIIQNIYFSTLIVE